MSSSKSDKELIKSLRSSNSVDVYNALVKIRTSYINNPEKMKRLEQYSVIEIVISFLEHPKLCNVSLSLIANACLDDNLRTRVIESNGIKSLMRILKSLANDDIQNRACRALGNIALSDVGYNAVHKMNPIFQIVQFLTGTEDVNCQQTAVRTLRILGNSSKSREIIVHENGILSISKLLQSEHKQVLQCSLKALAILTQNCSIGCARQLLESESIPKLIELYSHSDKQIQENSLMSLRNLTYQEEIRSTLVKVGAVQLFIEVASSKNFKRSRLAAVALCACLDHMHMWEQYNIARSHGLKVLLDFLLDKENADIHLKIISSLVPLCYEVDTIEILLELEIVETLIRILKNYAEANKGVHSSPEQLEEDTAENNDFVLVTKSKENENTLINEVVLNQADNWDCSGDGYCSETDITDSVTGISNGISAEIDYKLFLESSSVSEKNFKLANSLNRENSVEFSINSPSYKGIQKSDTSASVISYSSGYSSYCSPGSPYQICNSGSNTTNCSSPDGLYDWNPSSPFSNSSFAGSWSPSSDPDDQPVCWSPVLSTHPNSPEVNDSEFNGLEPMHLSLNTHEELSVSSDQSLFSNTINIIDNLDVPCFHGKVSTVEDSVPSNDSTSSNDLFKASEQTSDACISANELIIETDQVKPITNSSSVVLALNIEGTMTGKKRNISNVAKSASFENHLKLLSSPLDSSHLGSPKKKPKLQLKTSTFSMTLPEVEKKLSQEHRKQKRDIDYYILVLLLQISSKLRKKTNSVIASKACFSVLMDYLCNVPDPNPKAGKVLLKLVKNRYSFEKLVMCGFMSEIDERILIPHDSQSCSHCRKLDDIKQSLLLASQLEAESDYGVGTLSHILLTAEKSSQLHSLFTFSKFVTQKSGLFELLFNSDGLSLLLNSLTDEDEKVNKFASICLCYLYSNLVKTEHESSVKHFNFSDDLLFEAKCCYANSTHDVSFLLDSGVIVNGSRNLLCEYSEYFCALLDGYFAEKDQQVISLPEVCDATLSTMFHFLHGCQEETCEFIRNISFEVLLNLLSQCDRFMLFHIKGFAEKRLGSCLKLTTVSKIYCYSKTHNSPDLTKKAIHFALTLDVSQKDVLSRCIHELIALPPEFSFITDITTMIKSQFPEIKKSNFKRVKRRPDMKSL